VWEEGGRLGQDAALFHVLPRPPLGPPPRRLFAGTSLGLFPSSPRPSPHVLVIRHPRSVFASPSRKKRARGRAWEQQPAPCVCARLAAGSGTTLKARRAHAPRQLIVKSARPSIYTSRSTRREPSARSLSLSRIYMPSAKTRARARAASLCTSNALSHTRHSPPCATCRRLGARRERDKHRARSTLGGRAALSLAHPRARA
jgi:hypothetical protein